MKTDGRRNLLAPILFLLGVVTLWEIGPVVLDVPSYVLPRPSQACMALWDARGLVCRNLFVTSLEAIIGCALGSCIGFVMGVCMAESVVFRRMTLPYVVGSNAIPVVAIAPIVIMWFGHGLWSKSVVAAFLCFFPLSINTYRGLTEYEPIFADLFRVYGATRPQFFLKFKLPNAMRFVFVGMRLNATFSVIGAVVAEFVGSDAGLGFGMLQATYNLNTPRLYGYLLVSCLLGMLMYGMVVAVERLALRKREN